MNSPWPFAQWGVDLIGPLPKGRRTTYAIIAVEYFMKWAEVEALSNITKKKTIDFILRNIMCKYGIPYTLVIDNGKQFDNQNFREFYENLIIELKFCSLAHPQANRQVEAANKTINKLLTTRLSEKKRTWVDELPGVLWAYRTTHKTTTRETPFALGFVHEVVVPVEIEMDTHNTKHFSEGQNNLQMCLNLDLLVEKKELALRRTVEY